MKEYTLKIIIREGNDEFWESLSGKTGCDEVKQIVADCLADRGFYEDECVVKLTNFRVIGDL